MTQLPIACDLSQAELQQRKAGLLASLGARATRLTLTETGLEAEFPNSPELLQDILEMIRLESACCRFLQFQLRAGPDGVPTHLILSGPPGTSEFLAELGWAAARAV